VPPVALYNVGVGACCGVNETDPVVHGLMRVPLPLEIKVRHPTIAYDPGTKWNPENAK
jgi:hypothetical protein